MVGASSVLAGMLLTGIEPTGEETGKGGNGVTYKVSWNEAICVVKHRYYASTCSCDGTDVHQSKQIFRDCWRFKSGC